MSRVASEQPLQEGQPVSLANRALATVLQEAAASSPSSLHRQDELRSRGGSSNGAPAKHLDTGVMSERSGNSSDRGNNRLER